MTQTSQSTEKDAGALLKRLAGDAAAVERVCKTMQRAGLPPIDHGAIRRALLAAAEECATPLAPITDR